MPDLKEIFLKLYLDEDVSPVIGRILKEDMVLMLLLLVKLDY